MWYYVLILIIKTIILILRRQWYPHLSEAGSNPDLAALISYMNNFRHVYHSPDSKRKKNIEEYLWEPIKTSKDMKILRACTWPALWTIAWSPSHIRETCLQQWDVKKYIYAITQK